MASHGDVMTCAINRCTITCKTGTWKEYSKCNSCKHINRNIVLFRIRSVIRLLMSSHFYLYSAFNNTDCVKAALQYQIVSVMQKVLNHSGLHKHSQWSWLHWADRSNRNIRERLRDEEMIIVANHSRICWAREHYDQSVLFKNLLNCAQILAGMDVFKISVPKSVFLTTLHICCVALGSGLPSAWCWRSSWVQWSPGHRGSAGPDSLRDLHSGFHKQVRCRSSPPPTVYLNASDRSGSAPFCEWHRNIHHSPEDNRELASLHVQKRLFKANKTGLFSCLNTSHLLDKWL